MPSARRELIARQRAIYRREARKSVYSRALAVAIIIDTGLAWSLMIVAGIAHDSWWHTVPTMGYPTALAIISAILAPVAIIAALVARLN